MLSASGGEQQAVKRRKIHQVTAGDPAYIQALLQEEPDTQEGEVKIPEAVKIRMNQALNASLRKRMVDVIKGCIKRHPTGYSANGKPINVFQYPVTREREGELARPGYLDFLDRHGLRQSPLETIHRSVESLEPREDTIGQAYSYIRGELDNMVRVCKAFNPDAVTIQDIAKSIRDKILHGVEDWIQVADPATGPKRKPKPSKATAGQKAEQKVALMRSQLQKMEQRWLEAGHALQRKQKELRSLESSIASGGEGSNTKNNSADSLSGVVGGDESEEESEGVCKLCASRNLTLNRVVEELRQELEDQKRNEAAIVRANGFLRQRNDLLTERMSGGEALKGEGEEAQALREKHKLLGTQP